MNFKKSLKILNIEDFADKIFNSNSNGELFHLDQYCIIADCINNPAWFREWFISIVEYANENWERPESVFQHILRILNEAITRRSNT